MPGVAWTEPKYVDIVLFNDLTGASAAARDRVEDASGGRETSATFEATAAVFNLLRRPMWWLLDNWGYGL